MKNRKNILLLSAGRRVSLARALAKVASEYGAQCFTADMHPQRSAACQDSGHLIDLPHVLSPDYPEALAQICLRAGVMMVVPTIDTELVVLASLRESFLAQGVVIIVSAPTLISTAHDKRQTAKYFERHGITSPRVFPNDSPEFPVIAKPFDGSLSRDIHVLRSAADFTQSVQDVPNLMLAEYLDPQLHEEFTCDAYYDRHGGLCCIVPRLRLEVRGGEVSKGRTVRNNIVDLFWDKLARLEGARGCLTFQFFRNRETGALFLIELNARFGGGFPLTLAAGADFPRWLYEEWVLGKSPSVHQEWEDGLTMLRYDDAIFVPGGHSNE